MRRTSEPPLTAGSLPRVERAHPRDRAAIEALLGDAGLPTADLDTAGDLRFWVARQEARVVAAIGLEHHGRAGLLRSLVVVPDVRAQGLGGRLVDAVEAAARAAGIDTLALLAQTAERFFARRGYVRVGRDALPAAIRASAEFRTLCPASATAMIKQLAEA